MRVKKPASHT